jgi:hypothetical protein
MLGIKMCILEFFIITVQNTFASINIEYVRLKMHVWTSLLNLPITKFHENSMFLKRLHADGQKDMAELIHTFSQLSVASVLKMSDSWCLRCQNWLYLEYAYWNSYYPKELQLI